MPRAVVVGAGIGGYSLAVILSRAGFEVTVFEENLVGGECTNYGCAPTKALLHYAEVYEDSVSLGLAGREEPYELLRKGLREAVRVAEEERKGIEALLSHAGVELVKARATVSVGDTVTVAGGDRTYSGVDAVVVATGSDPLIPGWVDACSRVLDNRRLFGGTAFEGETVAVVGGGFIGVETAQAMARLGLRVTVYEAMKQLLPGFDRDLATVARRLLTSLGVEVRTSTPVERVKCNGDRVEVCAKGSCQPFDTVIVALGRRPRTSELRGVPLTDRGYVDHKGNVVKGFRSVYAVGDVAGPPLLAHKAVADALRAARRILNITEVPGLNIVPMVVYGKPELVQVEHPDLPVFRSRAATVRLPWGYNLVARIRGVRAQLVTAKLVYDRETGRLLAAYMAGPGVSELAGYLAYMVEKGVRVGELRGVIHPHPSASESLWESFLQLFGETFNRV